MDLHLAETHHVQLRGAQRAVRRDWRHLVVAYGQHYQADGYIYCFFGKREARRYRAVLGPVVDRLTGVLVITEPDEGRLITTYRHQDALRQIRRQSLPYRTMSRDRAVLRKSAKKD